MSHLRKIAGRQFSPNLSELSHLGRRCRELSEPSGVGAVGSCRSRRDLSGPVGTCRDLMGPVGTCLVSTRKRISRSLTCRELSGVVGSCREMSELSDLSDLSGLCRELPDPECPTTLSGMTQLQTNWR
jgi:hypothetical protein